MGKLCIDILNVLPSKSSREIEIEALSLMTPYSLNQPLSKTVSAYSYDLRKSKRKMWNCHRLLTVIYDILHFTEDERNMQKCHSVFQSIIVITMPKMLVCFCCALKYFKCNNEFLEGENYTILVRV